MAGTRVRRTAEDRRKQLLGIGLKMLTARPIHQITVDEVAAEAGISRGLLFHYFPTKQDYHAEVVRAASRRLLRGAGSGTVEGIVTGYVEFIERRREQYIGLFRAAGQDAWVREIRDATVNVKDLQSTASGTNARGQQSVGVAENDGRIVASSISMTGISSLIG